MLPHFYWKSNRARDRGTVLRPLPWPAPTHVNRNSFFRDSERVRIAAHLGLVEVNLGYLAQRCAGRLAGLLTSRLLHSFPLMRRSASRADDVDRVLGLLDEDNEQNTSLLGLTDQNRALRVQCVLHHRRERVSEHRSGLNERDSVLLQIRRGLLWSHVNRTGNKCNTLSCAREGTAEVPQFGQPVVSSCRRGKGFE